MDTSDPRGDAFTRANVAHACNAFGVDPVRMPEFMRTLIADVGLPTTLNAASVTHDSLPSMAEAADTVRLSNNPRRLTTRDALHVLQQAW